MSVQHDPSKCPFCGDLKEITPSSTGYYLSPVELHLLARIAELEGRLQQQEWKDMPIGPGPDGNYGQKDVEFDEERLNAIRKVLGKQQPDCQLCYDEEGSWACVRPAHGKMRHGKTENA